MPFNKKRLILRVPIHNAMRSFHRNTTAEDNGGETRTDHDGNKNMDGARRMT